MSAALRLACACLLAGLAHGASAQSAIYTCVDAKGRRLTSDRPIADCLDRDQKELNPNGTVRRIVPPTPTAAERAAKEAQEHRAAEERQHLADQKRMDKLLVTRYPNPAAHDLDRAKALRPVEEAIATSSRRIAALRARQADENDRELGAQLRIVAAQEDEKRRINDRFDAELVRLKPLWAQAGTTSAREPPANR
jgi:Domain of unknown function (DUF4124)